MSVCLGLNATDPNAMLDQGTKTEGYYVNMQPALAMAVQYGYATLGDHWAKFRAAKTLPNYVNDPRFAIIPRNAP